MSRSALTIARLLPATDPAPPDVPLLRTFVATGTASGEAAFEELVRRHGPMVLSTCRDTTTQLRDIAVAMRLHRLGQKPEEFGFNWSWPYGEDAGKPNKLGTFHLHATGFLRNSDSEAAHKKAREWLDKQKE